MCVANDEKKERKHVEDIDQNEVRMDLAGTGGIRSSRVRRRTHGECARAGGDADGCVNSYVDGQRHPDPDEYAIAEKNGDAYAYRHIHDHRHVDGHSQDNIHCGSYRHRDACCRRRRADHEAPSDGRRRFGRRHHQMVGDRGDGAWRCGSSWLRATDETALPLRRREDPCEQRNFIAASWRIHGRSLCSVETRAA